MTDLRSGHTTHKSQVTTAGTAISFGSIRGKGTACTSQVATHNRASLNEFEQTTRLVGATVETGVSVERWLWLPCDISHQTCGDDGGDSERSGGRAHSRLYLPVRAPPSLVHPHESCAITVENLHPSRPLHTPMALSLGRTSRTSTAHTHHSHDSSLWPRA